MKNVLGMICSPRRLGNCEIMVKEISRQMKVPHALKLIRLHDINILPCKGCYHCLFDNGQCVLDDDFLKALSAVVEADALIVAVPTYFLSANSMLKRFLDRCLAAYAHIDNLWGKPAVGIGVAGINGKEGMTQLCIESFLKFLLFNNKRSVIINGALPGEIFMNDDNKSVARDLAEALFEPVKEKESPGCPLCRGETFRFMGDTEVMCMVCSNKGKVTYDNGKPVFHIEKNEPGMFLTKEEAKVHKEWLLGMKDRFIENKKVLKKITIDYLNDGEWVE
jgi:multimeric flavodoxin WrbA